MNTLSIRDFPTIKTMEVIITGTVYNNNRNEQQRVYSPIAKRLFDLGHFFTNKSSSMAYELGFIFQCIEFLQITSLLFDSVVNFFNFSIGILSFC